MRKIIVQKVRKLSMQFTPPTEKYAQNNCAESAQIIDAIYTYHRAPFALKGPTTSPTSNFRDLYTDE